MKLSDIKPIRPILEQGPMDMDMDMDDMGMDDMGMDDGPQPQQGSADTAADEEIGPFVGELNATQLGIVLSMKLAGSPELAHAELSDTRNVVSGRNFLEDNGYIEINDDVDPPTAELTDKAEDVINKNALTGGDGPDGAGLSDKGKKLLKRYNEMKESWKTVE
jgi:hypothetical protein